ncbi:hypothetical protein [Carp edema virus]|nr:hypothetical protein [Carp edema virus]
MEDSKNYQSYVELKDEIVKVVSTNPDNKVKDTFNVKQDYDFLKTIVDIYQKHGGDVDKLCTSEVDLLKFIKKVELKNLSFIQICLVGNVKSVYNASSNKSKFLSNFVNVLHEVISVGKLTEMFQQTIKDNREIESDLHDITKIASEFKQSPDQFEQIVMSKLNQIIVILERFITKEKYTVRFIKLINPANDISESTLQKIDENFNFKKDDLFTFLELVLLWENPKTTTNKTNIKEIVKKVFSRSAVLREFCKTKTPEEVKTLKFKIAVFLNILFEFGGLEDIKEIVKDVLDSCKKIVAGHTKINLDNKFKFEDISKITSVLSSKLGEDKEAILKEIVESNDNSAKVKSVYNTFCSRFNIPAGDELYNSLIEKIRLILQV